MENLYFIKEQLAKGIYAAALSPTRELAQVAVTDIGAVAVRVLEDAGRFTGKRFDLAGDELNGNDAMAILSRVTGRPFSYYQVPLDVIRQRMGEDAVKMYEWFDRVGFTVDRAALAVSSPTSPSATLSLGQRRRIGACFMPKAVQFDSYGGIDVLKVRAVPGPVPGAGEVLVEVRAAGINPSEAVIRSGALHHLFPATFPSGQGSDLAGVVAELGPRRQRFRCRR